MTIVSTNIPASELQNLKDTFTVAYPGCTLTEKDLGNGLYELTVTV